MICNMKSNLNWGSCIINANGDNVIVSHDVFVSAFNRCLELESKARVAKITRSSEELLRKMLEKKAFDLELYVKLTSLPELLSKR